MSLSTLGEQAHALPQTRGGRFAPGAAIPRFEDNLDRGSATGLGVTEEPKPGGTGPAQGWDFCLEIDPAG